MVVVRPRVTEDMDHVLATMRPVHEHDGYPSAWPKNALGWLTPRGILGAWVAIVDSRIIGHVAVGRVFDDEDDCYLVQCSGLSVDEIAEVKRLFVEPSARGMGAATQLLAKAVEYLRAQRVSGERPLLHQYELRSS